MLCAGGVACLAGIAIILYSLFGIYDLAGACEANDTRCEQIINDKSKQVQLGRIVIGGGFAVSVAGGVLLVLAERRRDPTNKT